MRGALLAAAAMTLSACAEVTPPSAACESPAELAVTLTSGALLNPDESGSPLPTEVRVHQVRDAAPFDNVPFDDAWAMSDAISGAVITTQTTTLYPGEMATVALTPNPEAIALVGMAVVRRPAGRTWRVIVPLDALPCGQHVRVALRVDEYRIERSEEVE